MKKEKRRRPIGKGVRAVVRWQPRPLSALDAWVAKQNDQPTRAEAIRRLEGEGELNNLSTSEISFGFLCDSRKLQFGS